MRLRLRPRNPRLKLSLQTDGDNLGSLDITGDYLSTFQASLPPLPGEGLPSIDDPNSLTRLHPKPSRRVVTSVLGAQILVGGLDVAPWVVSFDLLRPAHGETAGTIELRANRGINLDPVSSGSVFVAGATCSIRVDMPGYTAPLLLGGYVTEPPNFRLLPGGVQSLRLAVGDLLLLRRQSESGRVPPYCGPLPRTTAEAAQIYANARAIPGVFGGEAVVENLNPDFIEGPPWDFLASLYEPLNYDVRSSLNGETVAVPRGSFNPRTALKISSEQALEGYIDSPVSKPFSVVRGYNSFSRGKGFEVKQPQYSDFTRWDPTNTAPWFITNNTYTITKQLQLGNTIVQEIVETWGYLPNNTVVPTGSRPGPSEGPCGEFIPAPELPAITTSLTKIAERTTRLFFEPHVSGSYLVNRSVETLEGWSTYRLENGDTKLYFGPLEGYQVSYQHDVVPQELVCPQYWDVVRVGSEAYRYNRVALAEFGEPEYRLTQREVEAWSREGELTAEGEAIQWTRAGESSAYDTANARWVGGAATVAPQDSPPQGQFIGPLTVPTNLEAVIEFPELVALFGRREAKPIQFSNAYSYRDLGTAIDRFAREAAGLAYAVSLVIDPRVPVRPGASVEYTRPDGSVVHGLAWAVEYNCTGVELTQSVLLMRTFTEPGLLSQRNNPRFIPGAPVDVQNPCE